MGNVMVLGEPVWIAFQLGKHQVPGFEGLGHVCREEKAQEWNKDAERGKFGKHAFLSISDSNQVDT